MGLVQKCYDGSMATLKKCRKENKKRRISVRSILQTLAKTPLHLDHYKEKNIVLVSSNCLSPGVCKDEEEDDATKHARRKTSSVEFQKAIHSREQCTVRTTHGPRENLLSDQVAPGCPVSTSPCPFCFSPPIHTLHRPPEVHTGLPTLILCTMHHVNNAALSPSYDM